MMEKQNLAIVLQRELILYSSQRKAAFWKVVASDLLKKHNYQNDFFLIGQKPTREEVVERLRGVISEQCQKYNLKFSEENMPLRTELKISFHYNDYKKTLFNEVSIVILRNEIILRILPHEPILQVFWIEESHVVAKMLTGLLEDLFVLNKDSFNQIQEEYLRIREGVRKLTPKTIEIAQSSITAIYSKCPQKHSGLLQKNLYSEMVINGKAIRIFHSDFLENPNVLLNQLK